MSGGFWWGDFRRLAEEHAIPLDGVKAFAQHIRNAKRRSIPFLFTLPEWWVWWQTDNRWEKRGRTKGCFVMARIGDIGPYSPANVYCATHEGNSADKIYTAEVLERMSRSHLEAWDRRKANGNPSHLAVRGDGHPVSKAVITPKGRFGSAALAAEAYGISGQAARQKARAGWKGWKFENET